MDNNNPEQVDSQRRLIKKCNLLIQYVTTLVGTAANEKLLEGWTCAAEEAQLCVACGFCQASLIEWTRTRCLFSDSALLISSPDLPVMRDISNLRGDIEFRRMKIDIIETYKMMRGLNRVDVEEMFPLEVHLWFPITPNKSKFLLAVLANISDRILTLPQSSCNLSMWVREVEVDSGLLENETGKVVMENKEVVEKLNWYFASTFMVKDTSSIPELQEN
eukprot:g35028.t1